MHNNCWELICFKWNNMFEVTEIYYYQSEKVETNDRSISLKPWAYGLKIEITIS